ncbi:GAF domain-containing protein [Streptomyces sp. NPDC050538]|uniref:GAF domain-containing protein n=1 Tax=Streptomyces sp. NPDC050538 TaxID=3365627 RepID=UPI0037B614B2
MEAPVTTSVHTLRTAHEQFVTTPGACPRVRDLVADSWRRCAVRGVHPDGSHLPPLRATAAELTAYRRAHPLAAALPLFRELLGDGAADDGHVFAVADTDGTLLWVEGDTATIERGELMHFAEGAVWSEARAGTNAPGTALELGRPVQIVTGEHYSCAAHAWSCAAAPVRDLSTGRVLGVIDLSGGSTIATPPALAAVRGAALAAEAHLARTAAMPTTTPAPDPNGVRLNVLGRDSALLEHGGRVLRLSPRHSEIVLALALAGHGVMGDRLAVELSDREVPPSTLRAEMTRLRAVLGPALLGSRPYALLCPVRTDLGEVSALLAEGRVAQALARYPGPPLPRSDAPVVVEQRRCLEQQLRGAVLGSGDPALLRRWVDADWGADDTAAWSALARTLPNGSPQRAAAAARARGLDFAEALPPQVVRHAAVLQRARP